MALGTAPIDTLDPKNRKMIETLSSIAQMFRRSSSIMHMLLLIAEVILEIVSKLMIYIPIQIFMRGAANYDFQFCFQKNEK